MLTVQVFTYNPFSENTYLIANENKDAIIVDPGCYSREEKEHLIGEIRRQGLTPRLIFLTHTHIDHVFGLLAMKQFFKTPIVAHSLAQQGLHTTPMVANLYGFQADAMPEIDQFINEGEKIWLGDESLDVLFCPGHAPDHLVLYSEKSSWLVVGDVLFNGSIGRTDLPGGNYETLMDSIHLKLMPLPGETVVYPGHGPKTTINEEITNNPFLK